MADFYFSDSQDFHEHIGMLDNEQYAQQQKSRPVPAFFRWERHNEHK